MRGWWMVMLWLVLYDINYIHLWMTTVFVDSDYDEVEAGKIKSFPFH